LRRSFGVPVRELWAPARMIAAALVNASRDVSD